MSKDLFMEFRESKLVKQAAKMLKKYHYLPHIRLMEICGTHTNCIFKYGIRNLLPDNIEIVSGPGCPVCVTPQFYVDHAIKLAERKNTLITTFGDMLKVPGSNSNLLKQKSITNNISLVYSPFDALNIARKNPGKDVVFLSIGFETTSAPIALVTQKAKRENIKNFFVLTANKTIVEALYSLSKDPSTNIDGYIFPGHVSTIIGMKPFNKLCVNCKIPGVIAGFEPLDILYSIIELIHSITNKLFCCKNLYTRAVNFDGNPVATKKINDVFKKCDSEWRGLGNIPNSGLELRKAYKSFDAQNLIKYSSGLTNQPGYCECGSILKGTKKPTDCKLFGNSCIPGNPIGACMVSSEGTCAIYYKYTSSK